MSEDKFGLKNRIKMAIFGSAAVIFACIFAFLAFGLLASVFEGVATGLGRVAFFGSFFLRNVFLILMFWGLPLHAVFLVFKIQSIFAYLTVGFFAAPVSIVLFKPLGGVNLQQFMIASVIFGALGSLLGAVFWFVAVKKNRRRISPAGQLDA